MPGLFMNGVHWKPFYLVQYSVDPPVINGDQMPLHRKERQKSLTIQGWDMYIKQNYFPSWEQATAFTQASSNDLTKVKPPFVSKGKGMHTQIHWLVGINYHWAPKGLHI